MEAQLIRFAIVLSALLSMGTTYSSGATYRTSNFSATAHDANLARKVALTAEHYRKELAIDWLGEELPDWKKRCPISVKVGQIGAGGATTFAFDRGQVFGWKMNVQGTAERILDSVIPHEVSHTIFASYFRRPLPRWADEGAATLVEHSSERSRQTLLLRQVWKTRSRISLRELLAIKEYPKRMQDVLTLYAEGYSLADFLVQAGGKKRYLHFLEDAHRHGWDKAIRREYNLKGISELEGRWNKWVLAGSPDLKIPEGVKLVEHTSAPNRKKSHPNNTVIRSQSPERSVVLGEPEDYSRNKKKLKSITLPRQPRGKDLEAPPVPQKNVASLSDHSLGHESSPWNDHSTKETTKPRQKLSRPNTTLLYQQPRPIATAKP